MRLVFMGTPQLALPSLDLLHSHHEILLVVCQPDKPSGRGHRLQAPHVKSRALELGLPVAQPLRARDEEFVDSLAGLRADACAVVAYGQILPRALLDMFPAGCVNLHFSLLPRWRGAAPVQHAILAGDEVTGITTQWMAEKLDSGDIQLQERIPIMPEETSGQLLARLAEPGAELLARSMSLMARGEAPRTPQDERQVTLAPTLKKEMAPLPWHLKASQLAYKVRALNPWPVATFLFNDIPMKVWRAKVGDDAKDGHGAPGSVLGITNDGIAVAAGEGVLTIQEVQAPGRPRMAAPDWARGARLCPSDQLG